MKMDRRQFMKTSASTAAAILMSRGHALAMSNPLSRDRNMKIHTRTLGKTGAKLSFIGFGGIVVMNAEPQHAKEVVADAVARGINYFDVAPSYGDAEIKLGPALKPFRDKVFLACKTGKRDKTGAKQELDNSLKRLETDYFDLYQLHAISDVEKDVKAVMAKDGAIQTFIEAKKAGIIKHIGFTAHSAEAAIAAMQAFDFDTMMYPVNFCTHCRSKFEEPAIKEARRRNMGIIAIKAMALQKWQTETGKRQQYSKCWYEPIDEPKLARMALSWTLSQDIAAALPPGEERLFNLALSIAGDCKKLTNDEWMELENIAQRLQPIFPA